MSTEQPNHFIELAKINVNDKTEKKVNLTYLSWAWAVDQLLRVDGAASWTYSDPVKFGETLMVFCTVTAFGKPMTAQLPVMDHRNKAIPNPDAFQVNTAMQRCLAKAISLHGLGLYIYAGEDLPDGTEPETEPLPKAQPRLGIDFNTTPCTVISVNKKLSPAKDEKLEGEDWTAWKVELSDGRSAWIMEQKPADVLAEACAIKATLTVKCEGESKLEIVEITYGDVHWKK